ncbi:chymotrypsin-like elastase family member 2A [Pollicipes pollicipes]|uniref:chymotrypsin-like elastase family member 2A n=1 Tax=Pollicipes pollicipes TaxID=41117 RepID=UPI001884BF20|nr:chymotrypsin-like elastase family member 2A [Pollicipes pollicipes]XP_037092598.1 chymotrypsin-like elastase family member 2A [Pollicipes pollicipes]
MGVTSGAGPMERRSQLVTLCLLLGYLPRPSQFIFPLTGLGLCQPRVTEVQPGQAVYLSSENYPLTYPRGACQRHVFRPARANTSLSAVCTDVDLDSLVVPWLNWRVWGDFLAFPGRGTVYGREWTQCETAPLRVDGAPGHELPLEFSANYLLQRRGYNCVVRAIEEDSLLSRQLGALRHKENRDCGRPRVKRIIDGKDAKPGQYPFLVYTVTHTSDDRKVYCAGTLLDQRFILTAAHCLDGAVWTHVTLGAHDVTAAEGSSVVTNATRFRQHSQWSIQKFNREHDIGLIELSKPVKYTPYIQPICLPSVLELEEQYDNQEAYIAGWGKTYKNQHGGSFILQSGKVRVLSNCECYASWPYHVTPLKICSKPGSGKQTHCYGDSGGPLMVLTGGRWTQIGISSFTAANQACNPEAPAGYTRVGPYLSWIQEHTKIPLPML